MVMARGGSAERSSSLRDARPRGRDPARQDDPVLRAQDGGLLRVPALLAFLFHVPFRGSIWVLGAQPALYLLVALGIRAPISSWVKASSSRPITLLVTFLPAVMLSGFLFDLRSLPVAVRLITYVLPARYFVALLQTVFLAGDVWAVIVPNAAVLALMAAVLLWVLPATVHKKLA
jgi:ABC-2 type transport system permease protein